VLLRHFFLFLSRRRKRKKNVGFFVRRRYQHFRGKFFDGDERNGIGDRPEKRK
jgi:hypothetical protein